MPIHFFNRVNSVVNRNRNNVSSSREFIIYDMGNGYILANENTPLLVKENQNNNKGTLLLKTAIVCFVYGGIYLAMKVPLSLYGQEVNSKEGFSWEEFFKKLNTTPVWFTGIIGFFLFRPTSYFSKKIWEYIPDSFSLDSIEKKVIHVLKNSWWWVQANCYGYEDFKIKQLNELQTKFDNNCVKIKENTIKIDELEMKINLIEAQKQELLKLGIKNQNFQKRTIIDRKFIKINEEFKQLSERCKELIIEKNEIHLNYQEEIMQVSLWKKALYYISCKKYFTKQVEDYYQVISQINILIDEGLIENFNLLELQAELVNANSTDFQLLINQNANSSNNSFLTTFPINTFPIKEIINLKEEINNLKTRNQIQDETIKYLEKEAEKSKIYCNIRNSRNKRAINELDLIKCNLSTNCEQLLANQEIPTEQYEYVKGKSRHQGITFKKIKEINGWETKAYKTNFKKILIIEKCMLSTCNNFILTTNIFWDEKNMSQRLEYVKNDKIEKEYQCYEKSTGYGYYKDKRKIVVNDDSEKTKFKIEKDLIKLTLHLENQKNQKIDDLKKECNSYNNIRSLSLQMKR